MRFLQFELKKVWREKRLLWLFVVILLSTGGMFYHHYSQKTLMSERATKKMEPLNREVNRLKEELEMLKKGSGLDDVQAKQFAHLQDMGVSLVHWKVAINHEKWGEIPVHEEDFLIHLQQLEQSEGTFPLLEGMEKEKAIAKNAWLRDYNLPYEDEEFPLSPVLFLKANATVHVGFFGILLLLLFFGATIIAEKEQKTWLTLSTQPIAKWRLLGGKYVGLLAMLFLFLIMVTALGILIPILFGYSQIHFHYPQIVPAGDSFDLISTFEYLIRGAMLFLSASLFAFSLIIFFSTRLTTTFRALLFICTTVLFGYVVTNKYEVLQTLINPFQVLHLLSKIEAMSTSTIMLSFLSAVAWSCLLLATAMVLPEKKAGLSREHVYRPFRRGAIQPQRSTWRQFTIFEWRKMKRKKLVKQVSIFLVALLALGYALIYQEAKEKEAAYFNKLKDSQKLIDLLKEDMSEAGEFVELMADLEIALAFAEERLAKSNLAIEGYKKGDWRPLYEYQLFENRFANNELDTGNIEGSMEHKTGRMAIAASLLEKQWLMEHHIRPVFPGEDVLTIFHYWKENEAHYQKMWEEENRKVDSSGLFSLFLYIDRHYFFVPLVLFFLLLGGGLAAERGKRPTLHFLFTQPLLRTQIFNGKWLSSFMAAIGGSVGLVFISLLIATIFNRFGDWMYPIFVYDSASLANSPAYTGNYAQGMGFHFIPIGEYVVQSIVLFLIVLMFLLTLTIFCSVWIKNQFSLVTFVTILVIAGYFIGTQLFPQFAHLSPFTYFHIAKIMNGETQALLDNQYVQFTTGSIVLLLLTASLIVIGNIVLHRDKRNIKMDKDTTKQIRI